MRKRLGPQVLLAVLALATAACSDPVPVVPTRTPAPPPVAAPTAALPEFPAVTEPARVFMGVKAPVSAYHGSALRSRYLLYDTGRFALQYSSVNYPFFEYLGTYHEAEGAITFHWEGSSTAGPWGATGALAGDVLTVKYNVLMQMSDFEDGDYLLVR